MQGSTKKIPIADPKNRKPGPNIILQKLTDDQLPGYPDSDDERADGNFRAYVSMADRIKMKKREREKKLKCKCSVLSADGVLFSHRRHMNETSVLIRVTLAYIANCMQ